MADPAPGFTTGQAKDALDEVINELRSEENIQMGWVGEAYQLEAASGAAAASAFGLGLLMVILILIAQYERITLPFAVANRRPICCIWCGIVIDAAWLPERRLLSSWVACIDWVSGKECDSHC